MSIRFWIAGPVTVLGLVAVVVAGWLAWGPLSDRWKPEVTTRAELAIIEHAAQVREAQHLASGLAASLLADTGENAILSARLREAVSSAVWHFEEIRALDGSVQTPAIARLGEELARWREGMDLLLAGDESGRVGAAAIAAQGQHLSQLAAKASDEVIEDAVRSEDQRLAEHRQAGGLSVSLLGGALLCMGWLALGFSRSLTAAMQALPRDLQAYAEGRAPGHVTGEAREDEFGDMARALRGVAEDIQHLSQSRAEMEKMALTDPLTGLPNRRGLHEFLRKIGTRNGLAGDGPVAILHLDLDHFKTINDTSGHEAGDVVLREATRRMATVIRDSDLLARVGGDEFVVFANGVESLAGLERLCERVTAQFEAPIAFRNTRFTITASVGAVLGGRRGPVLDPNRLLVNADIALCQAKALGRNRFVIFDSAMARGVRRQHEQASEIRRGIDRGEFEVWFTPIVDIRTARTTGLNIVPRWRHPTRGLLTARDFLAAAEAHGLTESMALPLLASGLRTVSAWRAAGIGVPLLHLGMSRVMLLAPAIVDRVGWLLDDTGCEPDRVVIQVSEKHCVGRGVEVLFDNLHRFSGLGVGMIVDDFGAVDAAIGTVARLGASRIKVAAEPAPGVFGGPAGLGEGRRDDFLRGFLRIGETLGIKVLAKHVDSRTALQRLAALGYSEMQGTAVAPSMKADATREWLVKAAASGPRLVAG